MPSANTYRAGPDERGLFGRYGGRFVAETLMPLILEVERAYHAASRDADFAKELAYYLEHYVGRPSPLYFAERLTRHWRGAKIYLKREDLNHTGAHKINSTMGQILLARRMGKRRVIAETGAGQHGVATATVCALFDIPCVVYMGAVDIERQQPNVFRMKLLGAEVRAVTFWNRDTEGCNERGVARLGRECRRHILPYRHGCRPASLSRNGARFPMHHRRRGRALRCNAPKGRLPDTLMACVGGGSNAMGLFFPFLDDATVKMVGVEAAGEGIETGHHAASINGGVPGVLHGNRTYLLQDRDGQIIDTHSVSAGLDYPGIGPEHAWLHEVQRIEYVAVT